MTKVPPRMVPDRDSKYMGLAWIHAGFSKDPYTQVGAQLVSEDNYPLGSGYNGPPRIIPDNSFSWERTTDPDQFGKNDLIVHAEVNAIDHSRCSDLRFATLYVTALPCPSCMTEIIRKEIKRVVYMDFQGNSGSTLRNASWREKTFKKAELADISLELFAGNIAWVADWIEQMRELGLFKREVS